MNLRKTLLTAATAMLLTAPAFAQADPHHPDTDAPAAPQAQPAPDAARPAAPQAAQRQMMGAGMMGGDGMMSTQGNGMMASPGGGMMSGAMMSRMMGMRPEGDAANPMAAAMAQHVEGRIGFIKAELAITEAQTPQWNVFVEALRADAKQMMASMPGAMSGASGQAATALDRLDAREKALALRLDSTKRVSTALKPLYAVLTAEQKQKADAILILMTGM